MRVFVTGGRGQLAAEFAPLVSGGDARADA